MRRSQGGEAVSRTVVWFSCGAASAVTAKLVLSEGLDDVVLAYTDPGSEHPDNVRFMADCEAWFGREVVRLKSDRYVDTWDVWEQTGYLVGPTGARCTVELKKRPRLEFQRPDDIHCFGFHEGEKHRADRIVEQNPGMDFRFPLIERGLTKTDCLAMVERAGIELPTMYKLSFESNNCIGCVKANSFSYWNRIRTHFPDVFDRMAELERRIGHSVCKDADGPVWLDELDPTRGRKDAMPSWDCSLMCALAEDELR